MPRTEIQQSSSSYLFAQDKNPFINHVDNHAYIVSTGRKIGSDAFRQEYDRKINKQALYKDIVSYLGEYRFQLPIYNYELVFGKSTEGEDHLCDVDQKEAMISKAIKAIKRREAEEKPVNREEAELIGLMELEKQINYANAGDTIIWVSPPGPKDQGYGDYGFVFVGTIDQQHINGDKHLSMSAVRVEQPSISQFNQLLSILTGQNIDYKKAEEFLSQPRILTVHPDEIKSLLYDILLFQDDPQKYYKFRRTIDQLNPHIAEFINMVQSNASKEELLRAFNTLEHLSIEWQQNNAHRTDTNFYSQNQDRPNLTYYMQKFNNKPLPIVGGNCGSSGSSNNPFDKDSSNILNSFSTLKSLFSSGNDEKYEFNHVGKCLNCKNEPRKLGPCDICEECAAKLRSK